MQQSLASAPYRGLYINLDRSLERRARMHSTLSRLGLDQHYSRLPAIDGQTLPAGSSTLSPGQLGCFHSHVRALELARGLGATVHILEDDAILSAHAAPVIADAVASGFFERFDLLFLDTFIDSNLAMLKAMKTMFADVVVPADRPMRLADLKILDLKQQNFACLTSYVVGARSAERVLALYRQELAAGPRVPVDLFIRDAVHAGKLRAACVFPFLTGLSLDEIGTSTIDAREGGRLEKPAVMVLAALRYSFFIDRDLDLAKRYLDSATKPGRSQEDAHHALIAQALEYVLSNDYQDF